MGQAKVNGVVDLDTPLRQQFLNVTVGQAEAQDGEVSCRQSRCSDPNTANAQPRPPPAFMATMATLKRPGTYGDSDVPQKPAWNEEG